jgi:hypothetical protein
MIHHSFCFRNKEDYKREYSIRTFFEIAQLKSVYVKPKPDSKLHFIVIRSNLFDGTLNNEEKHGIVVPIHGSPHVINTEKEFEQPKSKKNRKNNKPFCHKTSFTFYDDSGSKIENPENVFEFICIDVGFEEFDEDDDDDVIDNREY